MFTNEFANFLGGTARDFDLAHLATREYLADIHHFHRKASRETKSDDADLGDQDPYLRKAFVVLAREDHKNVFTHMQHKKSSILDKLLEKVEEHEVDKQDKQEEKRLEPIWFEALSKIRLTDLSEDLDKFSSNLAGYEFKPSRSDAHSVGRAMEKHQDFDFRSFLQRHLGDKVVTEAEAQPEKHPSLAHLLQHCASPPASLLDLDSQQQAVEFFRWWKNSWSSLYEKYSTKYMPHQNAIQNKKWLQHMNLHLCYWNCVSDLGAEFNALMDTVSYKLEKNSVGLL